MSSRFSFFVLVLVFFMIFFVQLKMMNHNWLLVESPQVRLTSCSVNRGALEFMEIKFFLDEHYKESTHSIE